MINIGELNKKIEIISLVTAMDADGFETTTETVIRSPWAKFSRTSGTETVKANADFGEIKARFLVQYTNIAITRKMKVRYSGKLYDIIFVNDYEDKHDFVEIWCNAEGLD